MTSPGFCIRPALAVDDAERDRFVRDCPGASFFHLSSWRAEVCARFGHRGRDLLAWRDGRIVGVFPLVSCRSPFGSEKLISMPYGVYGGPVGESEEVVDALLEAAADLARDDRVARLEMRCDPAPEGCDWTPSSMYATFVAELPDDPSKVMPSMPKKARAEARKARERHGLTLREDRASVRGLHDLFHENKRSLGSPGLPIGWFRGLLDAFGDEITVHRIEREGQALMCVMSFLWRDTWMAYYAGTAVGADRQYSVSNFAYMALREAAIERGFRHFDFGRSRRDSGAFKFKERQGFQERVLDYRYLLVRDTELPSFTPSNPKTKLLRDTWSRLPKSVARAISTPLSKYLP